ncbi:TetR/AcrR family transcriptional regulator [Nonomuraea sp. NPDC050022]|uniref:TetR/AcrR family transcriptional regulator n=1 Tax=Nonomuraea sp. NPDC050022 TaxID=3364358 RepID=UPI00378EA726
MPAQQSSRGERRKLRTRRALIEAAQEIYAERGDFEVSIQQITDAADVGVGVGTFYNHFSSKAELLDAAIAEALETHAAWLERLLADVDDQTVLNVLRMFGMAESEACRIVALPLPADEPPPGSI